MPTYTYKAADSQGKVVRKTATARDEVALERMLDQDGQHLINVVRAREKEKSTSVRTKLSVSDQIEMAYHLSVMCASGIPLVSALEDFIEQRATPRLKKVLTVVLRDVHNGKMLSEALSRHPRAFKPIFVHLVEAGEASGSLDVVMERFYKELEWQSRIKGRLIQALAYPAFLILALVGLVSLMLTFLLPKILGMLPDGAASVPLPTRILLAASGFLQVHWPWLLTVACALPFVWKAARFSEFGRFFTDKLLMHFPIVGGVVHDVNVARFISVLRTLLGSGVEVIKALEISGNATGNAVMRRRAYEIVENIRKGSLLSEAFKQVKEFNSMIRSMIGMSEKTGQINQVLDRITLYFDTTIPRKVKRMIAVMEPTIIGLAGVLVGFVLVGTLLPLFNLYASF